MNERINHWLWKRNVSLSIGAPLGDQGRGAALPGTLRRKVIFCFIRRPYLLGTPRDNLRKALATGSSLHSGPVGEPGRGLVLTGNSRDR